MNRRQVEMTAAKLDALARNASYKAETAESGNVTYIVSEQARAEAYSNAARILREDLAAASSTTLAGRLAAVAN